MVKHNLPVYYNPDFGGLHVIHSKTENTIIVGGCCNYYDDAYTNILRYEIPKYILKKWIRLNKSKLSSYSIIDMNRHSINIGINPLIEDKTHLFFKMPEIIKSWYV